MGLLRGRRRLVAAFLVLGLLPLALLAAVSVRNGGSAVRDKARDSVRLSARMSALYIQSELEGLAEVDSSFARRPTVIAALRRGPLSGSDRRYVGLALRQLMSVRPGIGTAFLADADGRLIDIVPATPSIVGDDFSYRDWYKGVTRTGRTYVSEAYRSAVTGHPLVVAVAAPVFDGASGSRRLGILVAAYRLDQIELFARRFARAEGVTVEVTDQRGVAISGALRGAGQASLKPRGDDPLVARALRGGSGVVEGKRNGAQAISAYVPVPALGWSVVASVPRADAYGAVHRLQREVILIAGLLVCLILLGAAVLQRILRARDRAELETREALAEARRLTSINDAVLDATIDGIALATPTGELIIMNAAQRRMLGELFDLPPGGTVPEYAALMAERVTEPERYTQMAAEYAKNPHYEGAADFELLSGRSFTRYTAPVRGVDGQLIGRIFVVRETTAEREAERVKDELVATVSHELRTPLASIMGFSELLTDREYDRDTQQRFLRTIRSESTRLTGLVNDFLDLQRIEAGRFTLALEVFDIGDVIRRQIEVFAGQSEAHELVLHAPGESVRALGEPDRIAQVVANLLSNAIKYSPAGGCVDVRVELLDDRVLVSVRDQGLGIPVAQQGKIFSKFFRVDTSDTREIGGTGLGLALCRELVEAHGGRMGFESAKGAGSTFWFELPTAVSPRNGNRPRVLIVEDEPEAASLLRAYLEPGDYHVDVVASGEQALAAVAEEAPAVICLDMTLSGELDGFDVLAELAAGEATAKIPVVVCTGGNGRNRAAALGAAHFLSKPFDARALREAVERLLPPGADSILVVDDDVQVRALVGEAFSGNGFELREAADGDEALAKIAARSPDVIILDLVMPTMDGFEVLERLQADPETRSIPVLILTGRMLSPQERTLLRGRAVALLEKNDYSGAELRALVDRALA